MKLFCNGFNLYKKFNTDDHIIEEFKEIFEKDLTDLEVSLTYAVFRKNNKLFVSGANYSEIQQLPDVGIIVNVCCTNDDIYILNKSGELYQINLSNLTEITEINAKDYLCVEDRFVQLSVGDRVTVGLTKYGHLYDFPKLVNFGILSTIDFKTGGEHCLILDASGNIYTFGRGSRGALGHGILNDEDDPKQVMALAGIRMVSIACGKWHCACISQDGDLYTWGWNQNGQLGLPIHNPNNPDGVSVMATPHVIDIEDNSSKVIKVACGKRHTIALLENGKLYGCGLNKYKQLLKENIDFIEKMTFLESFTDEIVLDIKCGPWNSIVCCQ